MMPEPKASFELWEWNHPPPAVAGSKSISGPLGLKAAFSYWQSGVRKRHHHGRRHLFLSRCQKSIRRVSLPLADFIRAISAYAPSGDKLDERAMTQAKLFHAS